MIKHSLIIQQKGLFTSAISSLSAVWVIGWSTPGAFFPPPIHKVKRTRFYELQVRDERQPGPHQGRKEGRPSAFFCCNGCSLHGNIVLPQQNPEKDGPLPRPHAYKHERLTHTLRRQDAAHVLAVHAQRLTVLLINAALLTIFYTRF